MGASTGIMGSVVYMTGGTTLVESITEWSADVGAESLDTSAFGSNWRARLTGIRDVTGSFSGNWDGTATAQSNLINSMLGGSVVELRLYITTAKYYGGSAVLTGHSPSISVDGKAEISFDFESTGAWTLT